MITRGWDPFSVIARLDDEFDGIMRRSWGAAPARTSGYVPAVDVAVDGPDVVITVELPGIDIEKDVDLEVRDGRLMISGERRESHEHVEGGEGRRKVLVRELRAGSFRREFSLPEGVTAEDITAGYDQGLLKVRIGNVTKPVAEPTKIAVTRGSGPVTRPASTDAPAG